MNPFEKQLVWIDGRTSAQMNNDEPDPLGVCPPCTPNPPVELPPPPQRVSIAEFERDMAQVFHPKSVTTP